MTREFLCGFIGPQYCSLASPPGMHWELQLSSVIDTLDASIWCLLTTGSYSEAVLKAVNLGGGTDTTAAVTGGLAGLLYGYDAIPAHWISQLAKKDAIDDLAVRLGVKMPIR